MDKAVRDREQMDFGFDNEAPDAEMKKENTAKKAAPKSRPAAPEEAPVEVKTTRKKPVAAATAESMAARQRDISVSEFFAKNRHLLGFDNPRKALLTTVKEAVDNALDACEEAQILPELLIQIKEISESRFTIRVRDNGPGIVKQQVPNIFARLLYGSKFHSLKMSRGQQGIGISAAGMYGLLTTGSPVQIISRTSPKKPAYHCHVQIDTSKNRPEVVLDEDCEFELPTGTSVLITLEGRYQKGRQSVDEYLAQTAVANPHAAIIYESPDGSRTEYERRSKEIPFIPTEIKPHPYGVELGLLFKMARDSSAKRLPEFLRSEFSRVSPKIADEILTKARIGKTVVPSKMTLQQAESLHKAINETKIMAPSSDCIYPIGAKELEEGLRRVVDAEFYASCTRSPAVYRGNPFLIEAAIAYGSSKIGGDEDDETPAAVDDQAKDQIMTLMRIANRVPLLYQQSACAMYKSVLETNWRNYGLQQSRGALPGGQVVLMLNMASVWVPFTSESKEAIAHYPEIIKEMKLAIQECGRKLGAYLRRQRRVKQELMKRGYIETYLPYIGEALKDILELKDKDVAHVVDKLKIVLEKSRKVG
jgi:DNA topoisomerase VI subunit B